MTTDEIFGDEESLERGDIMVLLAHGANLVRIKRIESAKA